MLTDRQRLDTKDGNKSLSERENEMSRKVGRVRKANNEAVAHAVARGVFE